ncbi:hypothetical protein [Leuconostoc fallax]|uniref:hypothetical protein n=1 Tax=Leuconostoc fallax TaxID=1251 RepID=UPI001C1ED4E3|nr:hypothetical protein [Leuconostoc fallax]MBU7455460.1 hypothetical protein [Leuconostoc fallax]
MSQNKKRLSKIIYDKRLFSRDLYQMKYFSNLLMVCKIKRVHAFIAMMIPLTTSTHSTAKAKNTTNPDINITPLQIALIILLTSHFLISVQNKKRLCANL